MLFCYNINIDSTIVRKLYWFEDGFNYWSGIHIHARFPAGYYIVVSIKNVNRIHRFGELKNDKILTKSGSGKKEKIA